MDNSKFLWTGCFKCAEPLASQQTRPYDANTSEATKTGERREAHRRLGNEAPTRSSTPSWQMQISEDTRRSILVPEPNRETWAASLLSGVSCCGGAAGTLRECPQHHRAPPRPARSWPAARRAARRWGVNCVKSWGTWWTTKVSCGQAAVWAFALLHVCRAAVYDVCTSTATKTGELREARGAECEGVER